MLWLGSSETVNRHTDLFVTLSHKYRIYRKSEARRAGLVAWNARALVPGGFATPGTGRIAVATTTRGASRVTRALELHMLEHHVTACAVINEAGNVLHLFGPTSNYLTPPVGEVRMDLMSWVQEASLYAKLRPALKRAMEQRERVEIEGMQLRRGTELVRVEVAIEPIPSVDEGLWLVAFRDQPEPVSAEPATPSEAGVADETLVRRLTAQLQEAQSELHAVTEELENANEEYRASYEELVSLNEELQSSNEELETTKEEAQSINEELLTVNRELEDRNEKLHSVNADLENLLTLTTIPTVFLDRQLRIRRYTPAAERTMWLVPSDLGRPVQHIQRRVQDERMLADAAKVLDELVPIEAEVRADDGRWYLRKIVPFRSGDRIDGVCVIFYDITAQKLAVEQSEEARYVAESIVRSSRQPFVVLNHELSVVSANRVFYDAFETSKDRVEGRSLARLCDGAWDIPLVHELFERVMRQKAGAEEVELEHDFEQLGRRHLRLAASLLERPGRTPLVLMSIEDVTPLREAQEIAIKRARELEQEHRRKDQFLAVLGHELRNPLAALVNGLALLEHVGSDPDRVAKIHPILVRQIRRMTVMLDQLLDVSRVSSGKVLLELGRVDLVEVARAAIEGVQPMLTASGHELVLLLPEQGTVCVKGDYMRLVQVLENLLANAVKYTEDHGTIWLKIDQVGDSARVSVRDTGIGIDPELLPHIFDTFTQGSQRLDRSKGGLGLGLALVRQLVEMHGGQVEAFSAGPGKGSEFVVVFPRVELEPAVPECRPPELELSEIPPLRVLVIDDEQDAALSLAELLRSYGHQVKTGFDGHTALAAASSFAPEVVLLDLGLPDIDGYEVASRLRSQLKGPVRIVAVTGFSRDDERLRKAGIDEYMLKPLSLERLAAALAPVGRV